MSQILLDDSLRITPEIVASKKRVGDTSTIGDYVFTTKSLDTDKAVQIVGDSIEVDEELLRPNLIYPVELKGETFYLRKIKGGLEIFQLSE
jgi:hypothetical protein